MWEVHSEVNSRSILGQYPVKHVLNSVKLVIKPVKHVLNSVKLVINEVKTQSNGRANLNNLNITEYGTLGP